LYMVGLGCIETNPWNSRRQKLNFPDFLVMDLDPEGVPFEDVVDVAIATHTLFDELSIPNVCKTSGGRGLHIYVPLGARYTHEEARTFAELISTIVGERLPDMTSVERAPGK